MSALFLATPFAGYEAAFYLGKWVEGYAALAESMPEEAAALWSNNSLDPDFGRQLEGLAADMPITVRVLHDALRVADLSTGAGKNLQVCASWQRIIWELRREADGDAHLLCVESDVVPPAGAAEALREGLEEHSTLAALSGAVSEGGWMDNLGTMAWRILRDTRAAYEVPSTSGPISWYDPELTDGIELVDAVPFGCLMVRLSTFSALPMRAEVFPVLGWDQEWCFSAWRAGRPVAVDWSLRCEHFRNLAERDAWWAKQRAA